MARITLDRNTRLSFRIEPGSLIETGTLTNGYKSFRVDVNFSRHDEDDDKIMRLFVNAVNREGVLEWIQAYSIHNGLREMDAEDFAQFRTDARTSGKCFKLVSSGDPKMRSVSLYQVRGSGYLSVTDEPISFDKKMCKQLRAFNKQMGIQEMNIEKEKNKSTTVRFVAVDEDDDESEVEERHIRFEAVDEDDDSMDEDVPVANPHRKRFKRPRPDETHISFVAVDDEPEVEERHIRFEAVNEDESDVEERHIRFEAVNDDEMSSSDDEASPFLRQSMRDFSDPE